MAVFQNTTTLPESAGAPSTPDPIDLMEKASLDLDQALAVLRLAIDALHHVDNDGVTALYAVQSLTKGGKNKLDNAVSQQMANRLADKVLP